MTQLPEEPLPEIAFAGRSNVGKSSLINRLVNRNGLVKVSARPGKTQSLNYFLVDARLYLVDLPGYGFAKVSKKLQDDWQELVTEYLSTSPTLRCVVVLIDIRHLLKAQDRELIEWLRSRGRPFIIVYTKRDKLSNNEQAKQAANLDAALGLSKQDRVLFSAKTGEGKVELMAAIATFLR
ncbi:MAG: GTP-binding protein [Deltaproteobacteria bacterium RIFOXYD12_FULL_53_23]|nr:MAG: GTP-binding protein [Deltaproteobacteria bacterium RIFOXYD12_FULL_53_23]